MKTHNLVRRGSAAAAVLALSVSLAACSSDDETAATDAPSTEASSSAPAETETTEAAADAPFGDGCSLIPTSGGGSFDGMVSDPVATAASNNPLLETLVAAVTAANLGDTLNQAEALTVFAPINDAFAAIPAATLNPLLESAGDQNSDLSKILTHHVLGERLEPDAIAGEQETLNGDMLTVEGDSTGMTVADGTVTANVACGGIQTANATVYAIDMVLTGATL